MVNATKSTFIVAGLNDVFTNSLLQLFQFKIAPFEFYIKYLSFYLKANNYHKIDWYWLIQKVEKRLQNWTLRWSTLGGRLVLILFLKTSLFIGFLWKNYQSVSLTKYMF